MLEGHAPSWPPFAPRTKQDATQRLTPMNLPFCGGGGVGRRLQTRGNPGRFSGHKSSRRGRRSYKKRLHNPTSLLVVAAGVDRLAPRQDRDERALMESPAFGSLLEQISPQETVFAVLRGFPCVAVYPNRRRSLDEGIPSCSRYLATVRRATLTPSFDRISARV